MPLLLNLASRPRLHGWIVWHHACAVFARIQAALLILMAAVRVLILTAQRLSPVDGLWIGVGRSAVEGGSNVQPLDGRIAERQSGILP